MSSVLLLGVRRQALPRPESLTRLLRRRRAAGVLLVWVIGLAIGAVALTVGLVVRGERIAHPIVIAILALVSIAAEREGVRLNPTIEVSVGSLLCVFSAVVFGPLSAVIVCAAGLLADLPRRDVPQPILRWVTWTAIRVIVAGTAGLSAVAVLRAAGPGFLGVFAAVAAAYAGESVADVLLTPVAPAIRGTGSWREMVRTLTSSLLASVPLQAPMVALLAYAYSMISPWSVLLFAIPAVTAQRLHLLYRRQGDTVEALAVANARLGRANVSFATALVATIDARDRYTAGHSAAVAIYARDIARSLSLSEAEIEVAHVCGLVHDVGKIGLPAGLLEKPGPLSGDERRTMEQHSAIGERILRNVDDYGEIAAIVRHHHERVDGSGYPDGLKGEEIPMLSRVIAVADAYNAMTSDRPYRDAMPGDLARRRLLHGAGSHFDAVVVNAFEAILAAASHEYRVAVGSEFNLGSVGQVSSRPSPSTDGTRPTRSRTVVGALSAAEG